MCGSQPSKFPRVICSSTSSLHTRTASVLRAGGSDCGAVFAAAIHRAAGVVREGCTGPTLGCAARGSESARRTGGPTCTPYARCRSVPAELRRGSSSRPPGDGPREGTSGRLACRSFVPQCAVTGGRTVFMGQSRVRDGISPGHYTNCPGCAESPREGAWALSARSPQGGPWCGRAGTMVSARGVSTPRALCTALPAHGQGSTL